MLYGQHAPTNKYCMDSQQKATTPFQALPTPPPRPRMILPVIGKIPPAQQRSGFLAGALSASGRQGVTVRLLIGICWLQLIRHFLDCLRLRPLP